MMTDTETNRENLLLTAADLATCKPIVGEGGHVLRALCPFHGSDRQRSLRVQLSSGRFVCFACGAWGYLAEARERRRVPSRHQPPPPLTRPPAASPAAPREPAPARPNLAQQLAAFRAAAAPPTCSRGAFR